MDTEIINWVPTVVSAGALGLIYWDIRRFKIETREDTKNLRKEMRAAFYDAAGSSRYIPRGECIEREGAYHDTFCKKIDTVLAAQKEAEIKRDQAREVQELRLGMIERSLVKISTIQKIVLGKVGLLNPELADPGNELSE